MMGNHLSVQQVGADDFPLACATKVSIVYRLDLGDTWPNNVILDEEYQYTVRCISLHFN